MIRGFKNWFSNLSPMQVFWFHAAFILFLLTTAIHNPTKKYSRDKLYIFPYSIPHPPSPHIRSYFYAYETDTQNGIRYLENSDNREAIIASGISAENIGRKMREEMNNFIKILHSNRDKEKEWVLAMERNGWTYENHALRRPKRWFFDPRGWNSNGSIKVSWMPDLTNLSSYLVSIATIFSLTGFLGWLAGIRANGIRAQRGNGGNTSAELSGFPSHCPPPSNEIAAPDIQAPSDQERASFSTEAPADLRTPAPRSSPGLPGTPTKAGSSFGGKMLSLFGKMLSLLITGIIVLVLGRSIGGYIGKQAAERELAKRSTQAAPTTNESLPSIFDFESLLPDIVSKMNERMPMTVDRDTRGDRVSSGPGNKLTFHYSLTRLRISDFDRNEMIAGLRKQLIEGYKNQPDSKFFKENNVTIDYSYVDVDGVHFATISIAPEDVD